MEQGNPYIGEIERVLPRLLALYDDAPASPTYGFGDRLHWAWKLTDFANGTFQGAAHGLAILSRSSLIADSNRSSRSLPLLPCPTDCARQCPRRKHAGQVPPVLG